MTQFAYNIHSKGNFMSVHPYHFDEIIFYGITHSAPVRLPKFAINVECGNSTTGFASPADDYIETRLDLNEYHQIRKHACFLVEAVGDSLIDAGISENDLLIVDTSLNYRENDVVVCCLNGSVQGQDDKAGRETALSRVPESTLCTY
ncbi:S24 family peptidase [Salmonirosea aquatica]|uniref:LexA family transcriptional regulator n=1 Tax=Salmonirosea aquatica TaxID=2654236 RepID=A0A7C9FRV4_9BACT|nr:LexA family transcriptional regulator [Cytophagaceae bacterium SJW1-29]